ncbi:MAG: UvrD-helicase domain-containing protein [Thermodesulfobacteria bacterium]|nr:UvrD-helicase domain-containing protein [Thermodesulfobacteriota bacterium]
MSVIIYNASAGSGKTYTLSLQYLNILKEIFDTSTPSLKSILAITFTNKAAFEMKERIVQFLKEIALETPKGNELKDKLNLSSKQAEELLNHIFLNYDEFQIKTIDSFLLNVYRAVAYELGLLSDFTVKNYLEDSLIEKALEAIFEKADEDKKLIEFFDEFVEMLFSTEKSLKIDIKSKFVRFSNELIKALTYKKELVELLNNYDGFRQDKILSNYLFLYTSLKEELEKLLFKEKTLLIGLWKEKLSQVLTDEGFIPWIYVKLGILYALIIDEFQDTDRLQWEAISPIVRELVSRKGMLVCAGDVKQSIFQWRGAAPELLTEVSQTLITAHEEKEPLLTNYRSTKEVVEFNNKFFSSLVTREDLTEELLKELIFPTSLYKTEKEIQKEVIKKVFPKLKETFSTTVQQALKNGKGSVRIKVCNIKELQESSQKKEAKRRLKEELFNEIKEILTNLSASEELKDVAILMRNNDDISELTSFLLSNGFKVIGSASLGLHESPVVDSLVCFLKLLINPEDQISLMGFLSSGFTSEGKEVLKDYENYRKKVGGEVKLTEFVKLEYPHLWENYINRFSSLRSRLNFYEVLREAVETFELVKKFPEQSPYIYEFLTLVLNLFSQGYDLEEFVEYWENYSEEGLELPKEEDSIKILSIHLAKGLEFDTVIVPLFWEEKSSSVELGLYFYEDKVFKGRKEDFVKDLDALLAWYLEKSRAKLELLNLMYVAFTRAIRNLVIITPEPAKGKNFDFKCAGIFNKIFSLIKNDLEIHLL